MPTTAAHAAPTETPRCVVCHRRSEARICDACHRRGTDQLDAIPQLLDRLAVAAVKSSPGIVEFVSGGSWSSRPPVAESALALTATTPEAIGMQLVDPQSTPGAESSIPLWVIGSAAVWRQRFGHHQPAGVRMRRPDAPPARARFEPQADRLERDELRIAVTPEVNAARRVRAAEAAQRTADNARVQLGLYTARTRNRHGHWEFVDYPEDGDDPLTAHWIARFGSPHQARRVNDDADYLQAWFDRAFDEFDDIDEFLLDLRGLAAAARAAVGEVSDLVYLGRCPEPFVDRDTGEEEPCGATLARDPTVSVVICPKCRTETNERGLLNLAMRMRAVWGKAAGRDAWTQ